MAGLVLRFTPCNYVSATASAAAGQPAHNNQVSRSKPGLTSGGLTHTSAIRCMSLCQSTTEYKLLLNARIICPHYVLTFWDHTRRSHFMILLSLLPPSFPQLFKVLRRCDPLVTPDGSYSSSTPFILQMWSANNENGTVSNSSIVPVSVEGGKVWMTVQSSTQHLFYLSLTPSFAPSGFRSLEHDPVRRMGPHFRPCQVSRGRP